MALCKIEFDTSGVVSQREAALKLGVAQASLARWLKSRDSLRPVFLATGFLSSVRRDTPDVLRRPLLHTNLARVFS